MSVPGFYHAHVTRAAVLGQLGRLEVARKSLADLLALRPDFVAEAQMGIR